METEELIVCLEEEKKTCLKNIQNYYRKYGCDKIETLKTYLLSLCETLTDEEEIEQIKNQIKLLNLYS